MDMYKIRYESFPDDKQKSVDRYAIDAFFFYYRDKSKTQLLLDEESRELVTINTHRGLYRYRRLPFGVASSPALFQKVMEQILQSLGKTVCIQDDILVTGSDDQEHLVNVEKVLHGSICRCWIPDRGQSCQAVLNTVCCLMTQL